MFKVEKLLYRDRVLRVLFTALVSLSLTLLSAAEDE